MNKLVDVLRRKYTFQILMALDEHGSMNISKLSKMVGGRESTILKRVKEMESVRLVFTYAPPSCDQRIKNTIFGTGLIGMLKRPMEVGE